MTTTTDVNPRPRLAVVIVVLTVLVPFAEFFALRLLVRVRTVIQSLGMPWPELVANVVQGFSVAVIVATVVLAIVGIVRRGTSRAAGIVALVVTVSVAFPVLITVGLLTFGDPGVSSAANYFSDPA